MRKKGQKLLAKNDFEKAYLLFQKAILINNSVENRFNLAVSQLSIAKYTEAETYLESIYNEYPENELNLLALAECSIMQRNWEKAIKFYQLTTNLFPNKKSYQNYLNIANDVVAREKYVKAKELFREATYELKLKHDEKALNILLQATEYFPEDATILNNIATLYIMLKDYKKAYSYSVKAISIKPDDLRFQNNLTVAKKRLKKIKSIFS
ncbi:MAG: tetratricopeptide repeat protein [Candidatus Tenebribacter davisii]|nr:tetratricopeptide repeat protein [Candidatus Tenebribacter davisii]